MSDDEAPKDDRPEWRANIPAGYTQEDIQQLAVLASNGKLTKRQELLYEELIRRGLLHHTGLSLALMYGHLREAFEEPVTAASSPRDKRKRLILASIAIGRFLEREGRFDWSSEFADLTGALNDLNSGTVRDYLQKDGGGGNPIDPTNIWAARAAMCLGVEALVAGGIKQPQAVALAYKEFPALSTLARKTAKNARTAAAYWLKAFRKKEVKNDTASHVYAENIGDIKSRVRRAATLEEVMSLARQYFVAAADDAGKVNPTP